MPLTKDVYSLAVSNTMAHTPGPLIKDVNSLKARLKLQRRLLQHRLADLHSASKPIVRGAEPVSPFSDKLTRALMARPSLPMCARTVTYLAASE